MDKQELREELIKAHQELIMHVLDLSEEQFEYSFDGQKWNAGQEVLHIIKSVKALNKALSVPKVALRLTFGTSNRPTRKYEQVVAKYKARLEEGNIVTTPPFEPESITIGDREALTTKLTEKVDELITRLNKFSEQDLDKYVIPHPLLGKMPLREMFYFTIYHVGHHLANSRRNLSTS